MVGVPGQAVIESRKEFSCGELIAAEEIKGALQAGSGVVACNVVDLEGEGEGEGGGKALERRTTALEMIVVWGWGSELGREEDEKMVQVIVGWRTIVTSCDGGGTGKDFFSPSPSCVLLSESLAPSSYTSILLSL